MKKLFALVVAAAMGISSAAFAADTTATPAATTAKTTRGLKPNRTKTYAKCVF